MQKEHESLNQELERSQRKLLKVARDNSFLLDRLLQYEQVIFDSPADSDATISSESDFEEPPIKKRNQSNSSNIVKVIKQENDAQDKLQITDVKFPESQSSLEIQPNEFDLNDADQINTSKNESEEQEVDMKMPGVGETS